MDKQEQKFIQMTQTPVEPLIIRLAIPCIISMLVTAFYNMADTYFVGMLKSNAATGAVGVAFSMMAIIQAVGFFFGQGSGNHISRCLGQKNYDEAEKMAATGFFSAIGAGTVICVLGLTFLDPLSYLLGSTDTILPYTRQYLGVILLGAPWMTGSLVLNNQLRFQGGASYAMVGITTGAVLNIILDPIMIFGLKLGVAGAAWATVIGQAVSFCVLFSGTLRGSNLRIRVKNFRWKLSWFADITRGGLPSLARQSLSSLATICLNHAAGPYGDAAIAAMGVVQRVMMFGASAMLGFGQGFQPVCGMNYGAGLHSRVKQGFWFCVKVSTAALTLIGAAGFCFAPQLIALFRDDPAVIEFGAMALRMQCLTFPLHGWIVMSNMMEQSMGRMLPATFLSVARQGLFFIPAVLILPMVLNAFGIQMAQSAADLLTVVFAVPIHLRVIKSLPPDRTQGSVSGAPEPPSL